MPTFRIQSNKNVYYSVAKSISDRRHLARLTSSSGPGEIIILFKRSDVYGKDRTMQKLCLTVIDINLLYLNCGAFVYFRREGEPNMLDLP